ncbi:MAG: hypothetical protein ACFB9M_14540 [Myxococcota bacterium]
MSEFFVGYAKTPARTKRFALCVGATVVLGLAVIGAMVGANQRRAGTATWNLADVVELEGVLHTRPYGMLHQRREGRVVTTLLVEDGKRGLRPSAQSLHGAWVRIRGTRLFRASEDMLALVGSDDAVLSIPGDVFAVPERELGRVELTGRAVDSKCFLGAMKPGDGAGHRPCAQLCIRGGIPPVLVSDDPEHPYVLIASAQGEAVPVERILPLVAVEHRYQGRLRRVGGLEILGWNEPSRDVNPE